MSEVQSSYAIIGAGPSLDYCAGEIKKLIAGDAHFLLSDSVAAAFLRLFPVARATVFTVEIRRHLYLKHIPRSSTVSVVAYQHAHERNFRFQSPQIVSRFKILGEVDDLPELYSPGTVLGLMLSYAVKDLAGLPGEIHILGADFSYIDNQVYARYIDPHTPYMNRLKTRENWQYEMTLKKGSGVIIKNGYAIRTSFELMQARENMRGFIATVPSAIRIVEYSPIGFDTNRVEKRVPTNY